jgi:hypothetical protein
MTAGILISFTLFFSAYVKADPSYHLISEDARASYSLSDVVLNERSSAACIKKMGELILQKTKIDAQITSDVTDAGTFEPLEQSGIENYYFSIKSANGSTGRISFYASAAAGVCRLVDKLSLSNHKIIFYTDTVLHVTLDDPDHVQFYSTDLSEFGL